MWLLDGPTDIERPHGWSGTGCPAHRRPDNAHRPHHFHVRGSGWGATTGPAYDRNRKDRG